ncbi:MAG TPA: hypothetical protein VGI39_10775 [Polyangiaceae bacterium]|jgi:hypothetical protein
MRSHQSSRQRARLRFRVAIGLALACLVVGLTTTGVASRWGAHDALDGDAHGLSVVLSLGGRGALRVIAKAASKAIFALSY